MAGSLFVISWVSALGAVIHGAASDPFSFMVSLAYPISDLVLLTLTVTLLARAPGSWRTGLSPLVLGISCLCVGDSGFAYLTTDGRYATGSLVDAGWIGGFLLIAGGAWIARPAADAPGRVRRTTRAVTARVLVPYVPSAMALVVVVIGEWTGYRDRVGITAAAVVVAAVLVRQLSATVDNRRLVEQLVTVEQELRFLAFHDPLTGLANRALFDDHLRHSLELHRRDLRPLMLLFCDLDDFKTVNDTLGHDSGDEVQKIAAERLRAATRAADTVARIGGDEFAVLIEDDGDPTGAAARIFEALAQPAVVHHRPVLINATIGVVALSPGARPIDAAEFLRRADAAMYQAKRNGKGSAAVWTEQLGTGRDTPEPGAHDLGRLSIVGHAELD